MGVLKKIIINKMESENSIMGGGRRVGAGSLNGPVRETELSRVINTLHKATDALHMHIGELDSRLTGILAPSLPSANEKAINPEYATPVAQEINAAIRKIDSLIAHVADIKSRLEV